MQWLVEEGARVEAGDIIAEIETDKAVMDVEAVEEGTIDKHLVAAGTPNIKVGEAIAVLLDDETDAEIARPSDVDTPVVTTPESEQRASEPDSLQNNVPPPVEKPKPTASSVPDTAQRVIASPLARKQAQEHGLDLATLKGSGPAGRIISRDIEAALCAPANAIPASNQDDVEALLEVGSVVASQSLVPRQALSSSAEAFTDDKVRQLYESSAYEVVPHDAMRMVIAERLTYSKQAIPHFSITMDCRIDDLLAARQRMNAASPEDGPKAYRLSVNDFLIKALGLALQHVPAANRTWTNDGMLQHKYSDVGVAVAIEGGLFTPILRHSELKSLSELSNEMKHLASKARARRLAPHEYQGGASSISNLGMYGVKNFDAVINPPQASILAVGAAQDRPVIVNGSVEAAKIMSCTLSCDHRVIDGAVGAEFLGALKMFIEDPVRMLV